MNGVRYSVTYICNNFLNATDETGDVLFEFADWLVRDWFNYSECRR